jgi:hypothetical protein
MKLVISDNDLWNPQLEHNINFNRNDLFRRVKLMNSCSVILIRSLKSTFISFLIDEMDITNYRIVFDNPILVSVYISDIYDFLKYYSICILKMIYLQLNVPSAIKTMII